MRRALARSRGAVQGQPADLYEYRADAAPEQLQQAEFLEYRPQPLQQAPRQPAPQRQVPQQQPPQRQAPQQQPPQQQEPNVQPRQRQPEPTQPQAQPQFQPELPPLSSITFYVFTRNSAQPGILHVGDENSFFSSGFDVQRPTKVIIHGFGSDVNKPMMVTMKDAYLSAMDVNVLSVDWSPLSARPWYPVARANVDVVGPRVAALLDWLAGHGASLGSVHLVGHSLGAHVAGIAGANVRSGRVSRISGLDPARPGFRDVALPRRLDAGDAVFVDVIHTTAGLLGMEDPIGHTDFYPNRGVMRQPGCTDLGPRCSHEKAYKLFRDSIGQEQYEAVGCDSMQDAMQGRCRGRPVVMGERASGTFPGIYFAVTR
ncbi:endothelial lipase-like isoform X2 [Thrips palmi]|uniref:Endothelial lipase-like isoform X2 n=1 Tax=Thrips palmi TaxID=161013 RepID=A0A6P8ZNY4_THRPL|nr:endothelial lipase-like isoform X2 [Thrips palmi]